ncbi:MAG: response regulator transcription factor [Lacunisphaera sp.]
MIDLPLHPSDQIHKHSVFVVDDHPLVRESLTALINRQRDLYVTGQAADSASAFEALLKEGADAAVVDLALPGESGLELIKKLQALSPPPRILVVSMHEEATYAERALRAGALGYVMKHETTDKVITAIRTVLRGEIYVSGALASQLAKKYVGARAATDFSIAGRLSDRELEIFRLIGLGHETRRIAHDLHLSMKTVQAHCASIKDKIGLANATELIREAVRWVEQQNLSS